MQTSILEACTKSKISISTFFVVCCAVSGLTVGLVIITTAHSFASSPTPPTISISEIMSCPSTGAKEWVELERTQNSDTQLPTSSAFSLNGYQLEDDKSVIWTGTDTVPEPRPITGQSNDPISPSIGGYFDVDSTLSTVTFSKHYLNNTGDILKLLSPTGELLEQVTIPECTENGKSWAFNDGDWSQSIPTPGQENPSPSPSVIPSPTVSPQPSTSPEPSPHSTVNTVASPSPTTKSALSSTLAENQNTPESNSSQSEQIKNGSTLTIPHPASYIAKINQNNQRDQEDTVQVLGITDTTATQENSTSASANVTQKDKQSPQLNLLNHDLLYSPDRSIFAYLSAILGGALLTTAAGLLGFRFTQAQLHI